MDKTVKLEWREHLKDSGYLFSACCSSHWDTLGTRFRSSIK